MILFVYLRFTYFITKIKTKPFDILFNVLNPRHKKVSWYVTNDS